MRDFQRQNNLHKYGIILHGWLVCTIFIVHLSISFITRAFDVRTLAVIYMYFMLPELFFFLQWPYYIEIFRGLL